jgi:hypothetical protein
MVLDGSATTAGFVEASPDKDFLDLTLLDRLCFIGCFFVTPVPPWEGESGLSPPRCEEEPEPPADEVCVGQQQISDPSGDGIPVDARMAD